MTIDKQYITCAKCKKDICIKCTEYKTMENFKRDSYEGYLRSFNDKIYRSGDMGDTCNDTPLTLKEFIDSDEDIPLNYVCEKCKKCISLKSQNASLKKEIRHLRKIIYKYEKKYGVVP
jgi:hypothetical protein